MALELQNCITCIRKIDAKLAISDNDTEVVNLLAPQQWHTTLDLTSNPIFFRTGDPFGNNQNEINDLKKRGKSSQGLSPFLLDLLLDTYSHSASIDSLCLRTLKPIAILLLRHPVLRLGALKE